MSELDAIIAGKTFKAVGGGSTTKLNVGDRFVGTYLGFVEVPSDYNPDKPQKRHDFNKPNGERTSIYGKGNLNYLMAAVPVNALVLVERFPDEKMEGRKPGMDMTSSWGVSVAE